MRFGPGCQCCAGVINCWRFGTPGCTDSILIGQSITATVITSTCAKFTVGQVFTLDWAGFYNPRSLLLEDGWCWTHDLGSAFGASCPSLGDGCRYLILRLQCSTSSASRQWSIMLGNGADIATPGRYFLSGTNRCMRGLSSFIGCGTFPLPTTFSLQGLSDNECCLDAQSVGFEFSV